MHRKMSFSVRTYALRLCRSMHLKSKYRSISSTNSSINRLKNPFNEWRIQLFLQNFTPICFQFDQTLKQIDQIAEQTKRYRIHNWIKCHFEECVWIPLLMHKDKWNFVISKKNNFYSRSMPCNSIGTQIHVYILHLYIEINNKRPCTFHS